MKFFMDRWLSFMPLMEADKDTSTGVKEQEPADTADDDVDLDDLDDDFDWGDDDDDSDVDPDNQNDSDDDDSDDSDYDDDTKTNVQSDDTNAIFAEARRIAEAKANEQVRAVINQMNEFAKSKGFDSWEKMQEDENNRHIEEERGKILAESADDPVAAIQKLVDLTLQNHPMVKQMEIQRQAEQERQAISFASESVSALIKRFPDCGIKKIEDVYGLENGAEIIDLWKKGVPLDDAFAVKNIGKITSQKSAAVKQKTLNSINAKSHLAGTRQSGSSDATETDMPRETYSMYRNLFPKWSKKQIVDHYSKIQKMTKG